MVPLESDAEAKAVLDEAVSALRDMGVSAEGTLVSALTTEVSAVISSAAAGYQADLLVLSPHRHGLFAALLNLASATPSSTAAASPYSWLPGTTGAERRGGGADTVRQPPSEGCPAAVAYALHGRALPSLRCALRPHRRALTRPAPTANCRHSKPCSSTISVAPHSRGASTRLDL